LADIIIDLFEVVILLGSCFLVNYVTADAKTNWAEGVAMVVFYIMIVSLFLIPNFCLSTTSLSGSLRLVLHRTAGNPIPVSMRECCCSDRGCSDW